MLDDSIVGIIISTRPDCIDEKKVCMISEYSGKYDVWIELGLQSANDLTLKWLKRGHTKDDFSAAVSICKTYGVKTTAHIIAGIPIEDEAMMMNTAEFVIKNKCEGIKIHSLYIVKNTELQIMFEKERFRLMTMEEYAKITARILRMLPEKMVVHRITGETNKKYLFAPDWVLNKNEVIACIKKYYN